MGLTKQYLRYVPAGNFNIIASQTCNAVFVTLEGQEGRFVAVGGCEHVIIWDLRLGEKAQVLSGERATVTALCASPNKTHLAAGYSDGIVQVYDLKSAEIESKFSGHHSGVTTLAYDSFGHKLASGSKDTNIIVWDTINKRGLSRLSGHRGPITKVEFMKQQNVLVSSSKDSFVKFWNLDIKQGNCFKTLTGHHTEVWSLALMKDDQYLVTGCGDAEIRVWKLYLQEPDKEKIFENLTNRLKMIELNDDSDDPIHPLQCDRAGSLLRGGVGRVVSLTSDASGQILGCHGTDRQIELFEFVSDDAAKLRLRKRLSKERKKERATAPDQHIPINEGPNTSSMSLRDEVKRLPSINLTNKPKSFHLVLGNGGELRVSVCLANNTVELYSLQTAKKDSISTCLRSITNQGHHSEIRSVSFSSDNLAIISGSGESLKLWSRPSQAIMRTVDTDYVLSTVFAPGDRYVLAGLKNGKLIIVDIAAGVIIEEVPAHTTELWSVNLIPDLRGCVTGGGDKTVKFWQFELIVHEDSESKAKVLSVTHTKTLQLEDSVLCVKMTPNSKFIAVALLDSTVKIFFVDTLKFYLSLYGHSLPVLCLDISSDSALIATGSADRNVKIWGMDFGDCHKSIFAHDDSVMALQFVPKTHYFFTCGKDGKVKEWDGDSYNKIVTLQGHTGEARSLAVSPNGQFVVSCGGDQVLRLYERSDQTLVLEDEEEEEREQQEALMYEEQARTTDQPGSKLPSKRTVGSDKAAESILECLEVGSKYREQLAEHEALQAASSQVLPMPTPPLLMQAFNASTVDDFFLETVRRIRPSDLEQALLILPFSSVCEVLEMLPSLMATRGPDFELFRKVSTFLLKLHHAPIVSNQALLGTLEKLQKVQMEKCLEYRDLFGRNIYRIRFLLQQIVAAEGVKTFRDETDKVQKGKKKRKGRDNLKRSFVTMS